MVTAWIFLKISVSESLGLFTSGHSKFGIKAVKSEAFDYLLKPFDVDELQQTEKRLLKSFETGAKRERYIRLFLGLTSILKQDQNANKNLGLYLEHVNLEQEMRSIISKSIYVLKFSNINCLQMRATETDIQKADSIILVFIRCLK